MRRCSIPVRGLRISDTDEEDRHTPEVDPNVFWVCAVSEKTELSYCNGQLLSEMPKHIHIQDEAASIVESLWPCLICVFCFVTDVATAKLQAQTSHLTAQRLQM